MSLLRHAAAAAFIAAIASAAADDLPPILQSTSSEEGNVGWFDGPKGRGTMSLVYSCASTIFACTWTVMHLNVPGLADVSVTRLLRKAKWLAVNILFPEFVFSKAVCELRLALRDHLDMERELECLAKETPWRETVALSVNATHQAPFLRTWAWKAEVSPWQRVLYRIFFLSSAGGRDRVLHHEVELEILRSMQRERPALPPDQDAGSQTGEDGDADRESEEESKQAGDRQLRETRTWTLTHTYYANMGGIYQPHPYENSAHSGPHPLTASSLAAGMWLEPHPLKELVLTQGDIQDKSKADGLVKLIAVMQTIWVVIGVAARRALDMPVTQLEIGTVAFCVVAVFTYLANWWKPKDVAQPTRLRARTKQLNYDEPVVQPYLRRVVSPVDADKRKSSTLDVERIRNDDIWMESDVPLITTMMAVSSFVFGGIHCLAWNFGFPTRLEQLLWRAASVATAGLPVLALAVSLALNLAGTHLARVGFLRWARRSLPQYPDAWWDAVRDCRPEDEIPALREAKAEGAAPSQTHQVVNSYRDTLYMFYFYLRRQVGTDNKIRLGHLTSRAYFLGFLNTAQEEAWREYERRLRARMREKGVALPEKGYYDGLVAIQDEMRKREKSLETIEQVCDATSRVVTISTGVLYAITRVIILAILFTSLRSVPPEVYDQLEWARFLPNFA